MPWRHYIDPCITSFRWKIKLRVREYCPIKLDPVKSSSVRGLLTPKAYTVGCFASLFAGLVIVIVMVVLAEYTKARGRLLLTALVVAVYFFSSLWPVWLAQRRSEARFSLMLSRVAIGVGASALLLLLVGIWGTPNSDAFWKSTAIVTLLGLGFGYISIVELRQGEFTRRFAVLVFTLAALMACIGIAAGINWLPYWWLFTLATIGWVVALLAPVARFLGRRVGRRFRAAEPE